MSNSFAISDTIDHLFRRESGKMISVLTRIFGTAHIDLAEDVVQDALLSALESWKYHGIPKNPEAWLYAAAKNKALDRLRRNQHLQQIKDSNPELILLLSGYTQTQTIEELWQKKPIEDDFLAMMFACCDPRISVENQVTFMLKILCGLSSKEIARAFITTEDTISKRIYRTKKHFRDQAIIPVLPDKHSLESRIDSVLKAIYLLFNEGYSSTHSEQIVREELMVQAMVLCRSLARSKNTECPKVYALMALMCFHSSRNQSRFDSNGDLILLSNQDRSLWNKELIQLGIEYLGLSASGEQISTYHIEAAIAYEHCAAKTLHETNWSKILDYYDQMLAIHYDPIVHINRSLVVLQLNGPQQAIHELNRIKETTEVKAYPIYHMALGTICNQTGDLKKARVHFQNAKDLTSSEAEKRLINDKILRLPV